MTDTVGTPNKGIANKETSHYLTRSLENEGTSNITLLDPKFPQSLPLSANFTIKTIQVD